MIEVYKATLRQDGRAYIGQSICAKRRHHGYNIYAPPKKSLMSITDALTLYGREAFDWDVVGMCSDRRSAMVFEALMIFQHRTYAPFGFNISVGQATLVNAGFEPPSRMSDAAYAALQQRRKALRLGEKRPSKQELRAYCKLMARRTYNVAPSTILKAAMEESK